MTRLVRVGDIDVPQDLAHERRAYRARRLTAVVFGLVLAAALLGLLGRSGPLSDTSASAGGLQVGYERFLRLDTPTELQIAIGVGQGETDIAISRALLDDLEIQSYSIEPQTTTALPDRVVFTFEQQPPSTVTLAVEPQRIGRLRGAVYGPGDARVSLSHWVWP